ncbi:helix-turn-helix transcriptional regulator [Panacibacter ginsenosidivorans]|uniref:Helix-turn-helix transcriptional regulator n=1 Tax=Panacibacter ginsenosidivorans TaxID=1813871 RepID=A0A5B8VAY8_9BACT|nr:helix-turn-helix transcriptional regulator [Panacibacter ginsenosidivorans]QEC67836.1 helix-turn-helix transcriptional regulator [Panacibacter ginsenosidivorans]
MDIQVKIGERIKALRSEKNLTQEAVAFKADVDRTYMNHVETGKRNISVVTLEKIVCNGLETSFKDFFEHESFSNSKRRGRK